MPTIQGLFICPAKSFRGISLEESRFDDRGLCFDRRWAAVGTNGKVISQRRMPQLAQLITAVNEEVFTFEIDGEPRSRVSIPASEWESGSGRLPVSLWQHTGHAIDQGAEAHNLLTRFLGEETRLVYMQVDHHRVPNRRPMDSQARLSFADCSQVLVCSNRSLEALNHEIVDHREPPVPMENFRPNVVLDDCEEPWEEERYKELWINGHRLQGLKLCQRCEITKINQRTGERGWKNAPLNELVARSERTYNAHKPFFGMYMLNHGVDCLRVGDRLHPVFGPHPEL